MSELDWLQIVSSFGVLIIVGSALAAYKLSWHKALRYALIWAGLFLAVALLFNLFGA